MPTSISSSNQTRVSSASDGPLLSTGSENARGGRYLVLSVVIGLTFWLALGIVLGALLF